MENTLSAQNEATSSATQIVIDEADSLPPEVAEYVRKILAEEDSLEKIKLQSIDYQTEKKEIAERPLYYDVSFSVCTLSPSTKNAHIHINCQQYMEEVNVVGADGVKYDVPIIYYPNSTELNTNGLANGEYVVLIQLEKNIFTKKIFVNN